MFGYISFSSSLNEKNIVKKIITHLLFAVNFLFLKNYAITEIMWKNIVEPDRSQMTRWSMCIACWLQVHTFEMCNSYCSSTATVVA